MSAEPIDLTDAALPLQEHNDDASEEDLSFLSPDMRAFIETASANLLETQEEVRQIDATTANGTSYVDPLLSPDLLGSTVPANPAANLTNTQVRAQVRDQFFSSPPNALEPSFALSSSSPPPAAVDAVPTPEPVVDLLDMQTDFVSPHAPVASQRPAESSSPLIDLSHAVEKDEGYEGPPLEVSDAFYTPQPFPSPPQPILSEGSHSAPVMISTPSPLSMSSAKPAAVQKQQNLESLLAKDAAQAGLPPPTPASTVTGPLPPSPIPMAKHNGTPSPLASPPVSQEQPVSSTDTPDAAVWEATAFSSPAPQQPPESRPETPQRPFPSQMAPPRPPPSAENQKNGWRMQGFKERFFKNSTKHAPSPKEQVRPMNRGKVAPTSEQPPPTSDLLMGWGASDSRSRSISPTVPQQPSPPTNINNPASVRSVAPPAKIAVTASTLAQSQSPSDASAPKSSKPTTASGAPSSAGGGTIPQATPPPLPTKTSPRHSAPTAATHPQSNVNSATTTAPTAVATTQPPLTGTSRAKSSVSSPTVQHCVDKSPSTSVQAPPSSTKKKASSNSMDVSATTVPAAVATTQSPPAGKSRTKSSPASVPSPTVQHRVDKSPSMNVRASPSSTKKEASSNLMHAVGSPRSPTKAAALNHQPKQVTKTVSSPPTTQQFSAAAAERLSQPKVVKKETTAQRNVSTAKFNPSTVDRLSKPKVPDIPLKPDQPHHVKPLHPSSHLLQATARSSARKLPSHHQHPPPASSGQPRSVRGQKPRPRAAADVRKVSSRNLLTSNCLLKPSAASKKPNDEGVAKAKARVRERMRRKQKEQSHSAAPTASSRRQSTLPADTTNALLTNRRSPHQSLAVRSAGFGKGLREQKPRPPTTGRPDPTVPTTPRFASSTTRRSEEPRVKKNEPPLADSTKILRTGLRSSYVAPTHLPTRKTESGLTITAPPKFSTSTHRHALPKSTSEWEAEEMERLRKPFKASKLPERPPGPMSITGNSVPSFMKPTKGRLAKQLISPRATAPRPSISNQRPDARSDSDPVRRPFKARRVPKSTYNSRNRMSTITSSNRLSKPTVAAQKRIELIAQERLARENKPTTPPRISSPSCNRPITQPKPFRLASLSRHEQSVKEQEDRLVMEESQRRKDFLFRAKPLPRSTFAPPMMRPTPARDPQTPPLHLPAEVSMGQQHRDASFDIANGTSDRSRALAQKLMREQVR